MNYHLLNDIDPDGNHFDELVDLNECSYYNIDNFSLILSNERVILMF